MTAAQEVLALLKIKSERDEQTLVGPSSLGSPCTYCLARQMLHGESSPGKFWLGARIGTAVHHEMEDLVTEHRPETLSEQRLFIGTIEGYGDIYGTADWTVASDVRDFKTTTQDKLKFLKRAFQTDPDPHELSKITDARFKLETYFNQAHLYGLGLENLGQTVETCTLIFICRDGKTDEDVWDAPQPYDHDHAVKVLTRAQRLWEYLQGGGDIESLTSKQGCYPCGIEGRV